MSYKPDPDAIPVGTLFTRQLSQRDLSLQIPVNFVTVSGIAITPACFANQRYEDSSAAKCFSNLLAVGFQRFELDVYWDGTRRAWSLCPVELGDINTHGNLTDRAFSATSVAPIATPDVFPKFQRQEITSTRSLTTSSALTKTTHTPRTTIASVSTTQTLSSGSVLSTGAAGSTPSPGTLIDVGPYSCTTSINLELFARVMASHLEYSQTDVNATLKYLLINLHVAAPVSDPLAPANQPSAQHLPNGNNILSSIFFLFMEKYLYTPEDLQTQRADLNSSDSWYAVKRTNEPASSYFRVDVDGHKSSSEDGWPSESFVEIERAKRIFVGFGKVDPQIQQYNFLADASTIFPQAYLQPKSHAKISSAGRVESGCFYRPNVDLVSSTNNSWATSDVRNAFDESPVTGQMHFTEAGNLTYCGISPVLHETLGSETADQAWSIYRNYVQSTIWSWGPGEPRNSELGDDPRTDTRCAVLNASSGYWQTEDCIRSHHSACRYNDQPYEWIISSNKASYTDAHIACKHENGFTAPRTSLENAYLLHSWRKAVSSQAIGDDLLWLNFNDLDAKGCWVVGQNSTCPYLPQGSASRKVIIPTVAAVIVFVLAALTIFVKCAANRQRSKRRRRRGDDGYDYEGVPS